MAGNSEGFEPEAQGDLGQFPGLQRADSEASQYSLISEYHSEQNLCPRLDSEMSIYSNATPTKSARKRDNKDYILRSLRKISDAIVYMLSSGLDTAYCVLLSDENIIKILPIIEYAQPYPQDQSYPKGQYAAYWESITWVNLFNISSPSLIEKIKLSYKFLYLDQYIFADPAGEVGFSIFKVKYIKQIQEVFNHLVEGDA